MPFYSNGTRVDLNSASALYQPSDSSGAACNLGSVSGGTTTPFYANGTQIYIKPSSSWHTIWSGTQAMSSDKTVTITTSVAADTSWTYRITGAITGTDPQTATGSETVGSASVSFAGTTETSSGGIAGFWTVTLTATAQGTTSMSLQRTSSTTGTAIAPLGVRLKLVEAYY